MFLWTYVTNNILKIVMYCSHPEFWAHFLLSDLHLCSSDYLMKQVKLIHVLLGMLKNFPVEIHFPTWLVPKV